MKYKNIDKIVIVNDDYGRSIEMTVYHRDGYRLFYVRDEKGIHHNSTVQDICTFASQLFTDFNCSVTAPNTVTYTRIYTTNKVSDNE